MPHEYNAIVGIFGYDRGQGTTFGLGNDATERLEQQVIASLIDRGTINTPSSGDSRGLYSGDQIVVKFRRRGVIHNVESSPRLLRGTMGRMHDFQSVLEDYDWLGPNLHEEVFPTPRQRPPGSNVYYALLIEAEGVVGTESLGEEEGIDESKLIKFKEDLGEVVSQIDISRRTNLKLLV